MSHKYGVGVNNAFAALGDEDYDEDVPQQSTQSNADKRPVPAQTDANKNAARGGARKNTPREEGAPARRGNNNRPRGGFDKPEGERREGGERRTGAPGAPGARGGRGGRGRGGRGGKREFDRHSGTGRGKEVSKDGHGAHAWGDEKDEIANAQEAAPAAAPAPATEEQTENVEPAAPAEPEEKIITVEEYMKEFEQKRANLPQLSKERKIKKDQFDGLHKLEKTDEDEDAHHDVQQKKQPAKKTGTLSLGEFHGESSYYRGGRGRGDRGGRYEGHGPRSRAPNLLDNQEFPTLATKAQKA